MKEIITLNDVFDIVSEYMNIDSSLLKSKKRNREIVECRQMICYFARKYIVSEKILDRKVSYQNIANLFYQNHATIMHSIKNIEGIIATNKNVRVIAEGIDNKFKEILCSKSFKFTLNEIIPLDKHKPTSIPSIP